MIGKCGWKEEELIDFVLGYLSESKTNQLQIHLADCERCQRKINDWQTILRTNIALQPSPFLKKRIYYKIDALHRRKRKKISAKSVFAAVSALIILFIGYELFKFEPIEDENIVLQNDDIQKTEIVHAPETARFYIKPVSSFDQIEGYVWINDATSEMLMEVEGLKPFSEKDYQLWLVHSHAPLYDELLHVEDGKVQLYYKGSDINYVTLLRVSLEPKGGSQTPTGPEPFFVDLSR